MMRINARVESFLSTNAALFLFYLLLFGISFVSFFHGAWHAATSESSVFVAVSTAVARGSASTINIMIVLLPLTVSKFLLTFLRRVSCEQLLPLNKAVNVHIVLARCIFCFALFHSAAHIAMVIYARGLIWDWSVTGRNTTSLSGLFLLVLFSCLVYLARLSMRFSKFRNFLILHRITSGVFFLVLLIHGLHHGKPESIKYLLPSLAVMMMDFLLRWIRTWKIDVASNTVEMFFRAGIIGFTFPRPFMYTAGQVVEIQVPDIDKSYHPFSIATCPRDEVMKIFIKEQGGWTKRLADLVTQRCNAPGGLHGLAINVRGPYGAPVQGFEHFDRVVLVSGGIGATPMLSVFRHQSRVQKDSPNNDPIAPPYGSTESKVDDLVQQRWDIGIKRFKAVDVFLTVMRTVHQVVFLTRTMCSGHHAATENGGVGNEETSVARPGYSAQDASLDLSTLWFSRWQIFFRSARCAVARLVLSFIPCLMACCVHIAFGSKKDSMQNTARLLLYCVSVACALFMLFIVSAGIGMQMVIFKCSALKQGISLYLDATHGLLSIALISLEIKAVALRDFGTGAEMKIVFILKTLSLLISIALLVRHAHGHDVYSANHSRGTDYSQMTSFIWAVPYDKDDEWLRGELAFECGLWPHQLRRFVTREKDLPIESDTVPWCTQVGRPDLVKLLADIARQTKNGSRVGVFYCGNERMEDALRKAALEIEVRSYIRGRVIRDGTLAKMLQYSENTNDVDELSILVDWGCNVRFCVVSENY